MLCLTKVVFSQKNADSLIVKNKVKVVSIYDSANTLVSMSKFDDLGRLIYQLDDNFGSYKSLKATLTKTYDQKGNVMSTVFTHANYNHPRVWYYEYDTNGNKTGTLDEFGNYVFKYFYDESGFKIKEIAFNDENKVRRTSYYEKFDDGKKIVEKTGNIATPSRTNTTTYDTFGNIVSSESMDGTKVNAIIHFYYENNRLVKTTSYDGFGTNYFYNQNGQLTEIQMYRLEEKLEITITNKQFEYNRLGLIEKYIEVTSNEEVQSEYRYAYDFYR